MKIVSAKFFNFWNKELRKAMKPSEITTNMLMGNKPQTECDHTAGPAPPPSGGGARPAPSRPPPPAAGRDATASRPGCSIRTFTTSFITRRFAERSTQKSLMRAAGVLAARQAKLGSAAGADLLRMNKVQSGRFATLLFGNPVAPANIATLSDISPSPPRCCGR